MVFRSHETDSDTVTRAGVPGHPGHPRQPTQSRARDDHEQKLQHILREDLHGKESDCVRNDLKRQGDKKNKVKIVPLLAWINQH